MFCGDFWQLTPVKNHAVFSNPFKDIYDGCEQKIFDLFWKKGADSIQTTVVLQKSMRTKDAWLKELLAAERYGAQSWEMYCFVHGLPTRNVGSWLPQTGAPTCGNARCVLARDAQTELRLVFAPWP